MAEIFYRAARGTVFVPVGAVVGSLSWFGGTLLVSLFTAGPGASWPFDVFGSVLLTIAMVSVTAAFIGLLLALAVGVPLLAILIYAKVDHWAVCGLAGVGCAALLAGPPQQWGAMEANVVFAGAVGGIAAWLGSRPNSTPHADARDVPPSANGGTACAGGRER